jgi:hypothetical protein
MSAAAKNCQTLLSLLLVPAEFDLQPELLARLGLLAASKLAQG